ncbi:AadA family aminoglycoside 3''-O-nucleotidyltransferase [Cupriavidus taiwanensis]|uniref:Aminoglycoside (3'') (9) adenylyltransferase n=1 Tax=Cupriavidus taiwanensis TaxID=164546 RepID=A0A7Z7JFY5_9BURK|nr:aminoglycoside nucleotidyltransferase [Cupriavidus taiwanensis]SOZ10198.1 Streptomycin 3''-adenylyltransferase [Cupriavidus taiwanensis]SOZ12367.1 Streptomycin 3''-adenylyltransferase [Cupriavidus taiwanensis]SOZ43672.1 Streptomycin 3''-adenylyltransferase [Cupriavidus taiwanensis]SPC22915.1 Streptomycin 3''-adenylyltransferase [Cupriavidus taiwanensis]SPD54423.1 Streptomycin 3''-adenylyltransferase [Cupriavidus taiwanensis]
MAAVSLPAQIAQQVRLAHAVLARHLDGTLLGVHLFGSTLDGGLRPHSDIDLLVTTRDVPGDSVRQALLRELLEVSAPPGSGGPLRPLEVTVVARGEVVPWRYPATRELQFGEWLRQDIRAGVFEGRMPDHDLAILLTQARQRSIALLGPPATTCFEPVPRQDFIAALADTVAQWQTERDWAGDERNVVLAMARIWYSAATGRIAPKDVAAAWALERLPAAHWPLMAAARAAYLKGGPDDPVLHGAATAAFMCDAGAVVRTLLAR